MKRITGMIAACLLCLDSLAGETSFEVAPGNAPVRLMAFNKHVLLVGSKTVTLIQKGRSLTVIEQPASISAAVISGTELWLGTDNGVKVYDLEDYKLKQTYFPATRISGIDIDAFKRIWIATSLKGVYMKDSDSFVNKVHIPGVQSLACTPDGHIWVGTNVGLYRIAGEDFKITRYAEEGYSGYELPDNIVEKLYKDDQSNVWVIMPDNISFKSNAQYQGEIPSYAYVGDRQNEVKTIVPVARSSYLFVTEKGLFFLPSSSLQKDHHSHGGEVFAAEDAQAFALDTKQLSVPEKLRQYPVTYAERVGNELYFITPGGGWRIREKDLIRRIARR